MKFGVGQGVPRLEDPRLLTGQGQFTDDVNLPRQLYAAVLRSPVAAPLIASLDHPSTGACHCALAHSLSRTLHPRWELRDLIHGLSLSLEGMVPRRTMG